MVPVIFNFFSVTGVLDEYAKAIDHGVHIREITDVSQRNYGAAREHVEIGMHLRHVGQYRSITGIIVDGRQSISVIHADLSMSISPDANVTVLWSDSPERATYLMNTFELVWDRAIDAEERIYGVSEQRHASIETPASVY